MGISADQITIAITVFNRRKYLKQAIASALDQTMPARVIVVEDCGPDPTLQAYVKAEFGDRINYIRNPRRRGLFGNWNACIEYCQTPWLSILHDDDYLAPNFIETMIRTAALAPGKSLYFGQTTVVNVSGQPSPLYCAELMTQPWRGLSLTEILYLTPFPFAGNIFLVADARAVGGFREFSQYCGDWETWALLIQLHGAVKSKELVAFTRSHDGPERGTNKIVLGGRLRPLTFVQHKRILALMRKAGQTAVFDRQDFMRRVPMAIRYLLRFGGKLSPRMLRYHYRLLLVSQSPHVAYRAFQLLARFLGLPFVKILSLTFGRFVHCD
jgi:glycosyltransferase involved in cell wall biosynthesis